MHFSRVTDQRQGHSTYRYANQLVRVNEALISLIWCALVGGIVTGALASHLHVADGALTYTSGVLTVVCAVVTMRRSFRIELQIDKERIYVRNYWRDFDFPWTEVLRVGMGTALQGIAFQPAILFVLVGDRKVRAKSAPYRRDNQGEILQRIRSIAPHDVDFPSSTAGTGAAP